MGPIGRIILAILVLAAAETQAAPYIVKQKGIYIGKDNLTGRHCFVQVRQWTPNEILIRTKTPASDWSRDYKLFAATDEFNRTIYLKNPARFSPKTLGIRYEQTAKVATIKSDGKRLRCKNLKVAQ